MNVLKKVIIKNKLASVGIFILLVILVYGAVVSFGVDNTYQKEAVKTEIKRVHTQFPNASSTLSNKLVTIAPKDKNSIVAKQVKAAAKGYQKEHDIKQFTILRPEMKKSSFRNISQVDLIADSYKPEGKKAVQTKKDIIKYFYVTADNKLLALKDLFTDGGQYFNSLLVEKYGKKAAADLQATEGYTLSKEGITVGKQYKIALTDIQDYLNDTYKKGVPRTDGKYVALTFDDGPKSTTTPQVLDILKQYKAKATFFVLGNSIAGNESLLKRELAEGHEIGNHSWDHASLPTLPINKVVWEIDSTNQAVADVTGKKPIVMRPPYGATNALIKSTLSQPEIMWTVDTLDWQNHNTNAILANIKANLQPGGVILMHDIHQTTVDALPAVLDYLTAEGYQCVTVNELYGYEE